MAREQDVFKIITVVILALLLLVLTAGTTGAQATPDGRIIGLVTNLKHM